MTAEIKQLEALAIKLGNEKAALLAACKLIRGNLENNDKLNITVADQLKKKLNSDHPLCFIVGEISKTNQKGINLLQSAIAKAGESGE